MKSKILLLSLAIVFVNQCSRLNAQDCVDSSLIDLMAACPLIWAPVCGCNGVTYANDCEATFYGGVTTWTPGECATGCMDMAGLDFGMCDMFLGFTWINGSCAALSGCSYIIGNIDYSPNFYTTSWECQQNCGSPLTDCVNQWQIEQGYLVDCAPNLQPVCGCNGVEYSNSCNAFYYGGVTSFTTSPCSENDCLRIPLVVNFGECAMPLGWARLEQGCSMVSGCSYVGQNGYDYSSFFFTTEEDCLAGCTGNITCIDSSQIDLNVLCPAVVDPVCGCDGITYNNSCEATNYGGVTEYTAGPCIVGIAESDEVNFSVQPNPFENSFRIQVKGIQPQQAVIVDLTGRIIETISGSKLQDSIDTSSWPDGMYILQVYSKNSTIECIPIVKK